MNWQAIRLTLRLASTVSIILMMVGMPIAYWLAFSRRRWKVFAEALVALPLVLPPTVLGFYLLVALGPLTSSGRSFQRVFGYTPAFTFSGLVIASVLYSLPFAVQPMHAAFVAVDPALMDAAATLGASRLRTFARVIAPLSMAGLVSGLVLSFAHTVGEFGVVLMVGGNIPGVTRTISIAIYDDVQELNYAAANQTALVLLVFSYVVLLLVYGSNRSARSLGISR